MCYSRIDSWVWEISSLNIIWRLIVWYFTYMINFIITSRIQSKAVSLYLSHFSNNCEMSCVFSLPLWAGKILNSQLCPMKVKMGYWDCFSLLNVIFKRWYTLDNRIRKLKNDDLFHYCIILLGEFNIFPFLYFSLFFSMHGDYWWIVIK